MRHTCHWPDCGKPVPPSMWGCREHWFKLPKQLRDQIWKTYRAERQRAEGLEKLLLQVKGKQNEAVTAAYAALAARQP